MPASHPAAAQRFHGLPRRSSSTSTPEQPVCTGCGWSLVPCFPPPQYTASPAPPAAYHSPASTPLSYLPPSAGTSLLSGQICSAPLRCPTDHNNSNIPQRSSHTGLLPCNSARKCLIPSPRRHIHPVLLPCCY